MVNGRGRSGEQTAGGHPKASPRPGQPPFAGPALRELESACRLSIFEMLSQYPRSAFQGFCRCHQRGSAAVCDPSPPRPFARCRFSGDNCWGFKFPLEILGPQNHFISRHFRASKIALTKARLLKQDLHFHGKTPTWWTFRYCLLVGVSDIMLGRPGTHIPINHGGSLQKQT